MRYGKILLLCLYFCLIWGGSVSTPALAQQRTLGPVLRIYTDPFLFDTVRCRIRRCVPLTFHNIGDTALVVHNHDLVRRPFSVRVDTPLVLQPGEMRTFELCYNPSQYTADSQRVFIRADTRLPLSIAMVHDVSSSMFTDMPGGKKRYQAAHDASVEFIGNLLDTLGIEDEAAVFTYDDNERFKLVQTWTKDTAVLRAAIPNVVLGTATCTYDAISRVIDSMDTRVKKRILIMVTDGEDSGPATCGIASPASVIKKAQDHGVRIYAITIGNIDRTPLIQIAKSSGGKEFNATLSTDLLAIYREIAVDMSKNVSVSVFMKGAAVGPKLEIDPPQWSFDSVQVGETACENVLVRNGGNAWLLADSVRKVFQPPYSLQDLAVDSIAPFQTVPARVCFTPLLPLHYQTPMPYYSSPCVFGADTLIGSGSSYLLPRVPVKKPLLEISSPQFDTTFCQTTECRTLELRNVGDTAVTVQSLDFIPPPFSGSEAVPFTVLPGETKAITVCYRPPDAPRLDTLALGFTADMRAPQRIALFFDESASMRDEFMPGLSRLLAATAGASDFADGLEFRPGFTDAVTVAGFDSAGVLRWDGRYFTDRDSLRAALPDSAGGQISCAYDAMNRLLTGLDGLHDEPETVVLFSAGEDAGAALCGPVTSSELASHALAMGVRIHCVQIGDADSTALEQLALATGGRFLRPRSLLDLILGLRDLENEFSRNIRYTHRAIARGVTPLIAVSTDTVDCGSHYPGSLMSERVGRLWVMNYGDAPMRLWDGGGFGPDFRILDTLIGPDIDTLPRIGSAPALRHPGVIETVGEHRRFAPGDTLTLLPAEYAMFRIAYAATMLPGIYRDTLALRHNVCNAADVDVITQVHLLRGVNVAWAYHERIVLDDTLDFGRVPCGEEARSAWRSIYTGRRANTLRLLRPYPPMFDAEPDTAVYLYGEEGWSPTFTFAPTAGGTYGGWLRYESLDEPPLRTVFLLASDVSTLDTTYEGTPWRALVREGVRSYVDALHPEAEPDNRVAMYGFDASGMSTVRAFTPYRQDLWYALPDTSFAAAGDMFAAIGVAMDSLRDASAGARFLFVVLGNAASLDASAAAALRERAEREGVTLAIAAVSAKGHTALSPTAGLAGRFDSCFTLAALERFLYETTQLATLTVRDSMYLTGTATEGRLEIAPTALEFGRIRVGGDNCLPVSIRNSGNATLRIIDVVNPAAPFPPVFPDTLAAGETALVELCFEADGLGTLSAQALFIYDGCGLDTLRVAMQATGFDSVNVGITGQLRGMPGSVIRIPVQIFGAVPTSYGVRGYELSMQFNKTMLYPIPDGVVSEGTATDRMSQRRLEIVQRFVSDSAETTVTYRISGGTDLSASVGDVLLAPPFLVLHGDAMETPLRLTAFGFTDRSPSAGIASAGTFIADSLCFQEQRLVDASDRYNASLLGGYPNPFNPVATIGYALREAAPVRLSVHDALGREIRVLDEGLREPGVHRASFDAGGLPTGVYFYRLESGSELLTGSLMHLK